MPEIGTSGSMSGDGKRSNWLSKPPRPSSTLQQSPDAPRGGPSPYFANSQKVPAEHGRRTAFPATDRHHRSSAEPWVLHPAAAANLNDADRTKPSPPQIVGKIDQQAVRLVVRSVDDRRDIALVIEPQAAHLMAMYPAGYIELRGLASAQTCSLAASQT